MYKKTPLTPYKIAALPHSSRAVACNTSEASMVTRRFMKKTNISCLFATPEDFAAFKNIKELPLITKPCSCDCFIVEDVSNIFSVAVELDDYDKTYIFLPNNIVWQTVAKTLENRNKRHIYNCSCLFKGYKTLHEFIDDYTTMIKK